MPRNGSGTYTLPSGNPVVSGTTIEASWANNTLSDVGNELTNSLARTGAGGMTGALRLADGSAAVPGLAWSNETTTGLYRAGSGDMRLSILTADVQQWTALGSNITGAFDVSGNLTVGGTMTITGGINFNGNVTVGDSSADTLTVNATITSNLIFTDNTYDIGASGATRPRNLYLSNNLVTGGSIAVDSTTDSTSTTTGSIQTDGGLGVAKAAYIGTTLNVVGNTTLGDASTDTVTVNGYMGVGGAPNVAIGVFVRNTALTGVSPSAFSSAITLPATATSFPASYYSQPSLAASAFTVSDLAHFQAGNPSALSGGAAITNLYGLYINDQTRGTNNYGITSLVSSGTNKWNIYASGTAQNLFAGHLNLSSGVSTTQYINYGDGTTNYARLEGGKTASGQGSLIFHTYLGGTLNERMRIDPSGNVLLNQAASLIATNTADGADSSVLAISGGGAAASTRGGFIELYGNENGSAGIVELSSGNVANSYVRIQGRSSTSYIRFDTNSTERMRIDSSGNVGIGTSSPTNGKIEISSATAGQHGVYATNTATTGASGFISYNNGSKYISARNYGASDTGGNLLGIDRKTTSYLISNQDIAIGAVGANVLTLGTNNAERLRIDSSGNVGIGTSSPGAKLDVSGAVRANVASYNQFIATRSSQSWVMGIDASNNWVVRDETGGDTKMYLSTSGNLGLGVTPSAWLTAYGAKAIQLGASAAFVGLDVGASDRRTYVTNNMYIDSGGAERYINTDVASKYVQAAGEHRFNTAPSGTAGNAITFTQAMTLDASGNLLVGTTTSTAKLTSVAGSAKIGLYVEGYLASNPTAYIYRDNTDGQYGLWIRHDAPLIGSGGTGYMIQFQDRNGGALGSITSSGTGAGSTAYNTSSDYRLKNFVVPMVGALAKVSLLKPVTFKWHTDNSDGQGFIAHELQEVFPEAVTGVKDDVDDEGKPVYQGVDTSFLVATLTAAIQELKAENDALKARLDAAGL